MSYGKSIALRAKVEQLTQAGAVLIGDREAHIIGRDELLPSDSARWGCFESESPLSKHLRRVSLEHLQALMSQKFVEAHNEYLRRQLNWACACAIDQYKQRTGGTTGIFIKQLYPILTPVQLIEAGKLDACP